MHPNEIWAPGPALFNAQTILAQHAQWNQGKPWSIRSFDRTYKGPRPAWAQRVTAWYDLIKVPTDLPGFQVGRDGLLPRPRAVLGIILPSKTAGRHSPTVFGASTKRTGWDKGHLMALSLGGPDSPYTTIPQPRKANQKLLDIGGNPTHKEKFRPGERPSWRAMELYLVGLGTLILREEYGRFEQAIHKFRKQIWRLKAGVHVAREVGRVVTYASRTVLGKPEPEWILVYYAEPKYTSRWPGNIAESVYIRVVACSEHRRIELFSLDFDWESDTTPMPFDSEAAYKSVQKQMARESKERARQRREQDRRQRDALAAERLRSLRRRRGRDPGPTPTPAPAPPAPMDLDD